ncbi:hypothetical protein AB4865_00560 [Capnocytophaga sp. ARDL2]|uniref:hypothetical protein n=1 Tax=Capnocytophaga sp. ARDL2 TaxID=3238809 RepID=UPI0035560CC8
MRNKIILAVLLFSFNLNAQTEQNQSTNDKNPIQWSRFSLSGYGVINYYLLCIMK